MSSSAERLLACLQQYKDSSPSDNHIQSLCSELRTLFCECLHDHLSDPRSVRAHITDASSILELLEFVVAEYDLIFTLVPEVTDWEHEHNEAECLVRWLIHCLLNLLQEPTLQPLLYKSKQATLKCLSTLADYQPVIYNNILKEFSCLLEEILSYYASPTAEALTLQGFSNSIYCNSHNIKVQYRWCFDQMILFTFEILDSDNLSRFLSMSPNYQPKFTVIVMRCLFNSLPRTKNKVLRVILSYRIYCQSSDSYLTSKFDACIIHYLLSLYEKPDFCEIETIADFSDLVRQMLDSVALGGSQSDETVSSVHDKSVKFIVQMLSTTGPGFSFFGRLWKYLGESLLSFLEAVTSITKGKFSSVTLDQCQLSAAFNTIAKLDSDDNLSKSRLLNCMCRLFLDTSVEHHPLRIKLENLLNSVDPKVPSSKQLILCNIGLIMETIAISGNSDLFLEACSDEVMFDAVSVTKKILINSFPLAEDIRCSLLIIRAFMAMTRGLNLEKALLHDITWMASLPFLSVNADWCELEPLKSKYSRIVSSVKNLGDSRVRAICVQTMCLIFEHGAAHRLIFKILKAVYHESDPVLNVAYLWNCVFVLNTVKSKRRSEFLAFSTGMMLSSLHHNQSNLDSTILTAVLGVFCSGATLEIDHCLRVHVNHYVSAPFDLKDDLFAKFFLPLLNLFSLHKSKIEYATVLDFVASHCVPVWNDEYDSIGVCGLMERFYKLFLEHDENTAVREIASRNICILLQLQPTSSSTGSSQEEDVKKTPAHAAAYEQLVDCLHRTCTDQKASRPLSTVASLSKESLLGRLCLVNSLSHNKLCPPPLFNEFVSIVVHSVVFTNDPSIHEAATDCMQVLAISRGCTIQSLLTQHKEMVSDLVADICALLQSQAQASPNMEIDATCQKPTSKAAQESNTKANVEVRIETIIECLCRLFSTDFNTFSKELTSCLFRKIVYKCPEFARLFFCVYATLHGLSIDEFLQTTDLLVPCVGYILSFGSIDWAYYLQCFPAVLNSLERTIPSKVLGITFEVLQYLCLREKEVLSSCGFLAQVDGSFDKELSKVGSQKDIPCAFIRAKLVPILVHFKTLLWSGSTSAETKTDVIRNTTVLMRVCGEEHVSRYDIQVLDNLRLMQKLVPAPHSDMDILNCRAFRTFVRTISTKNLSDLVPQVAIAMTRLLHDMPHEVADIFETLGEACPNDLSRLYFLPNVPAWACKKLSLIQNSTMLTASDPAKHAQHLQFVSKCLQDEISEGKLLAIEAFTVVLSNNASLLDLFSAKCLPPCAVEFIRLLILQFNVESKCLKLAAARCFSVIGAIDPARVVDLSELGSSASGAGSKRPQFHNAETVEFKFQLLSLLAQCYNTSSAANDSKMLDLCAYSIQKLLSLFHCKAGAGSGQVLWRMFDVEMQQFLAPFLTSKYTYRYNRSKSPKLPFYSDHTGVIPDYKSWICQFILFLIRKVPDSQQQTHSPHPHNDSALLFQACEAVLMYNADVAMYLLPVVIVELIMQKRTSALDNVVSEFFQVLDDITSASPRSFAKVASQAVFVTIETISTYEKGQRGDLKWRQAKNFVNSDKLKLEAEVTKCDFLRQFLQRVPSDLIARAAFSCGSCARSVMYLEDNLYHLSSGNSSAQLSLMQQCFVELREPDGVEGIVAIRSGAASTYEKVLRYKSQNRMNEALICGSSAIAQHPHSLVFRREYLDCLKAVGQTDSLKYHAKGYVKENPAWQSDLLPYSIDACWKLCDWSLLEEIFKSDAGEDRDLGSQCQQTDGGHIPPSPRSTSTANWDSLFGQSINFLVKGDETGLSGMLEECLKAPISSLTAASMEHSSAYLRGYESLVKLQMTSVVQCVSQVIGNSRDTKMTAAAAEELCDLLSKKESVLQPTFSVMEPSRQLKRSLLTFIKYKGSSVDTDVKAQEFISEEISKSWLATSRLARETGYLDTALNALEHVGSNLLLESVLERSKLSKAGQNSREALALLQCFISENQKLIGEISEQSESVGTAAGANVNRKMALSKILLQTGMIMSETQRVECNKVIEQLKAAAVLCPQLEDAHFQLGLYYEKLTHTQGKATPMCDAAAALRHQLFVDTLRHGNKFIYQALPKLLAIWFDCGQKLADLKKATTDSQKQLGAASLNNTRDRDRSKITETMEKTVNELNRSMSAALENGYIAPYQFFTAYTQLVSRICHPLDSVWGVLRNIIVVLVQQFPHQALWMSISVWQSSDKLRAERCKQIFGEASSKSAHLRKYIEDAIKLADRLQDMSKRSDFTDSELSLKTHFRPLHKLFEPASNFSHILLPRQVSMTIAVPEGRGKPAEWKAFGGSGTAVYIHRIEDKIEVMNSLQRPKKILIVGSDGTSYPMMAKPKDDLRKDHRLMEFNCIINKFLNSDTEARNRRLHIRTYAVVPLSEDCGLIEWVSNTNSFRAIVMRLMREQGIGIWSNRELKACCLPKTASPEAVMTMWRNKLLPAHTPAVFHKWFLRTFADPTSWLLARLAYCRTAAVMSVVGYILGLGDRHGENILIDATRGDVMHVDFNLLFNKGETLEYPEVVPFRLTHNMVDAMGIQRHEGFFRKACEVTMRLVRERQDSLLSVLKPFLHDPLVEWSKSKKRGGGVSAVTKDTIAASDALPVAAQSIINNGGGESLNEQAVLVIGNIEDRLQGKIKSPSGPPSSSRSRSLPLSVEGQVDHIITEAISEDNLCRMYVGWAAFL